MFTTNSNTEKNAENILIGKKNTLDYHFILQNEYESSGDVFVEKAKFKLENLQKFHDFVKGKGIKSKEALEQLKFMHSSEHFKNDKQIDEMVQLFKLNRLW